MFTLVLGGRRSGKSLWAENEALALANSLQTGSGKMLYIATAPPPLPDDLEMQRRISEHQQRRESQLLLAREQICDCSSQNSSVQNQPMQWVTIEEPLNLLPCLKNQANAGFDLFFIDCVTLWLFNLMQQDKSDENILQEVDVLAQFLANISLPAFVISNEVGMGVAPATELGNRFCDLAGRVNQILAKSAKRVVFVAAGLPLFFK